MPATPLGSRAARQATASQARGPGARAAVGGCRGSVVADDPALDRAVAAARNAFLDGKPFDRLDVALLVRQPDGTWRRGSFSPDALAYPASCVKLPYLAAAMHWCRTNGHPYEFLDGCVGPMIRTSGNLQTGVVVDAITGTANIPDLTDPADPRFAPWLAARGYPESFLNDCGLLAEQTIVHKTYPTNSGEMPLGAEKVARTERGMNRMSPRGASALMLQIVGGVIEPAARDYMFKLLEHDPRGNGSVLGFGLPPGTRYINKPGLAYDTLEDIAYAVLPNGRELIAAVFSNAFCRPYSEDPCPHDRSQLGPFMATLLEVAGLTDGCPPVAMVDCHGAGFAVTGQWRPAEGGQTEPAGDALSAPSAAGATAAWRLGLPQAGRYEVLVRYPQAAAQAPDAVFTVRHAGGETPVTVDQTRTGDRWYRLGDFAFRQGQGLVELAAAVDPVPGRHLVAAAVQAARYPDTPVAVPPLPTSAIAR